MSFRFRWLASAGTYPDAADKAAIGASVVSMRRLGPRAGILIGLLFGPAVLGRGASHRVTRTFDQSDGLPVSVVVTLAQDSDGFLWISTAGGLARFDGTEIRPWGTSVLKRNIDSLFPGPTGQLLLLPEAGETLFERTSDGIAPVAGPDGRPFDKVVGAAFFEDGRLWVARRDALFSRPAPGSAWMRIPITQPENEGIRRLRPGLRGELLVVTRGGLWTMSGGVLRKLWSSPVIGDAIRRSDGVVFLVDKPPEGARVLELRGGSPVERLMLKGANANRLAVRGDVVWLALDRFLVALRDGCNQGAREGQKLRSLHNLFVSEAGWGD